MIRNAVWYDTELNGNNFFQWVNLINATFSFHCKQEKKEKTFAEMERAGCGFYEKAVNLLLYEKYTTTAICAIETKCAPAKYDLPFLSFH